ncbi:response regulator transcription factor [uncultured Chryseobacterium sp.]|uniref:response regulator transcription factor n=1 Tax=uncultured Chryseobacterium sp. TaxID=259322 RepID=UPI00258713F4|nr:response regulator transcription factor [uncultured Chryseobacterium sp.]
MNKPKILYLEDDHDLGEITTDMLTRMHFSVQWVNNGIDGLKDVKNEKFDIIIADIMMPQLDGYSFLKEIRDRNDHTPLILISARVLTEDVLKGFSLGADDYMRKPFSIEELNARIHRILKRSFSEKHSANTISVGNYEYNHSTYQLTYQDKEVMLSPRSGEILYRLATNKDGFLPRKETLLELWGDDHFFNGRSLDVFISKLRKYLSEDPRISIINIRATGYRLIVS